MSNDFIDLERIEKLRIHELRDFAREIGVKSPTSLNRPELVEQIRLILTGEQKPYFNVRKQGRPARREELDMVELITPNENQLYEADKSTFRFVENNPSYVLKCNEFVFETPRLTDRVVEGYVDIHPNGYGLLRRNGFIPSNADTFIPQKIVARHELVSGMYIRGMERFVADGKPYALVSVSVRELPDADYDSLSGKTLGDSIGTYLNLDVKSGGRYFIKNENMSDIFHNAYSIASSVIKENEGKIDCRIVFTRSLPERLPQKIENVECLDVPFNKSDNDLINAVNLFVSKAKIDACNRKVVLILTGLSEIARAYNCVLNNNCEDVINVNTASKINNILACAKNIADRAGITLIVVDNMRVQDKMKALFDYEILPNFTN